MTTPTPPARPPRPSSPSPPDQAVSPQQTPRSARNAAPSPPLHSPGTSRTLSGRRVVASGLIVGSAGLVIALFLRAIVANTPVRVTDDYLFWSTVLAGAFGLVAGMAVEAVRQLQRSNPDPEYHRGARSGRHRRSPGQRGGPGRG